MNPAWSQQENHPVRAAQAQIAAAFVAREEIVKATQTGGLAAHLLPILQHVGWQGTTRQIAEAMPHENPVNDIDGLRVVLHRLGIESPYIDIAPSGIRPQHCPCLLIGKDGIALIVGRDPDGRLRLHHEAHPGFILKNPGQIAGQVRLLHTGDSTQQDGDRRGSFVWSAIRSFRHGVIDVFWKSLAINLFGLAISLYVMLVYDKAIATHSLDTLALLAIGVVVGLATEFHLRKRRADTLSRIAARLDATVAIGSLTSVLGLPLQMSEGAPLGSQLSRFRQFEIGRELFSGNLATALIDLPYTLLFFALIFTLGGPIGFVPVALAVTLGIIGLLANPVVAHQTQKIGELKSQSDSLLVEMTTRAQTIQADNSEAIWIERASKIYGNYTSGRFRSLQLSTILQTVSQALVSIAGIGVLGLGAMGVMQGNLTVGALIAIMAVVWRVLGPIQTVFLSLHRLRMLLNTVRQIEHLMKIKPERGGPRAARSEREFVGVIEISNVCQRYGSHPELALKAVSLAIKPGEFVTVTGGSGAGKSTLLKAMLGLYPIQTGTVRIGGLDLRQVNPAEIRHGIAFLPQEPLLFFGTVAQNLRFCSPDAKDAELEAALGALGISNREPALPEGIHTRLGAAMRQSLSPALIQRIALARVFVHQWPIILLDEPSTHLDRDGDDALMKALMRLKGRSTIVMVTARPSHMRLADRVVIMDNGQIAKQGHPDKIVPAILSEIALSAA